MKTDDNRVDAYTGPRPDIEKMVPTSAARILDVGCSNGALGLALKKRQACELFGVELDSTFARQAEARLDGVLTGDVEALFAGGDLTDWGQFECVIFADILEHLRDPWAVLAFTAEHLLKEGGRVIVSLPNIRFWDTWYNVLVRGYWPYRDRGIHDRTHVRFFARKNCDALFESCGLTVVDRSVNYRFVEAPSVKNKHAGLLRFFPFRDFFAFQYVFSLERETKESSPKR